MTPIPEDIERRTFDVIVIGAGVNGTGIARDAAMRGLKVLLLDKGDLVSGTSSRSARMIHGGLRYLEHREWGLVWECLEERKTLIRIAPHLVGPQPLVIPFYKTNKRRPWKVRLGLAILDFMAMLSRSSVGRREVLSRQAVLQRIPGLTEHELTGAAVMIDAYAEHGERLCIENVLSAAEHGATVVTYARTEDLIVEDGAVAGVRCLDTIEHCRFEVRGAVTVNAAGPWVDRVFDGDETDQRLITGSKGSFLVVDSFPGAPTDSCFYETIQQQRQAVVLPWNGFVLLGTTDIRYDDNPDDAVAGQDEIEYLLEETNRLFPKANLTKDSIRFTYAGVRPLPFQPKGAAGGEGSVTRKHIIHDHAPKVDRLFSILGGKFSTFRSLVTEAVDRIYRKLGEEPAACRTHTEALPGAATSDFNGFCDAFRNASSLSPKSTERLLNIYGTRSGQVMKIASEGDDDLIEPFDEQTGAIGAEIVMAFRHEFAQTLGDVLIRRTMVGYDSAFDAATAVKAARIAKKYFDWNEQRTEQELNDYQQYVMQCHEPRTMSAQPVANN